MRPWIHASSLAIGVVLGAFLVAPGTAVYSKVPDRSIDAGFSPSKGIGPAVVPVDDRPTHRRSDGHDAIVQMTSRDRALIAFQRVCPVCGEEQAVKKTPGKVQLTVFVCGRNCLMVFDQAPRDAITKWVDICEAKAKAAEKR